VEEEEAKKKRKAESSLNSRGIRRKSARSWNQNFNIFLLKKRKVMKKLKTILPVRPAPCRCSPIDIF
jgi:hypothetical protein